MNRACLIVSVATWALLACGAHRRPVPLSPMEEALLKEPEGLEPAPPGPFRLHPGDIVALRTISTAPLEVPRLEVDEAGLLHAPLIGTVPVAGLSLEEAEARLRERLLRYDRSGVVSITLVEAAGHKVSVLGAIARPGTYVLGGVVRVTELLAMAGGLRTLGEDVEVVDQADLQAARLIRGGAPLPISLPRALTGDVRHNIPMAPGDVLFVPPLQGAAIRVLGQVRTPRVVPWRQGLRLSDVLAQAGGLTRDADEAEVRIVRGPLSSPRIYQAHLSELLQGSDVELARGDIVFVPTHWFASATDVIQRLIPLLAVGTVAAATTEGLVPPVSK